MSDILKKIRERHEVCNNFPPSSKHTRDGLLLIIERSRWDRGDLLTMLDAATARADAATWQPIETAPRDGTPVDLWHKCGTRFTEAWWTDDDCWTCLLDDSAFTHWMPLPKPPEQTT